MKIRNEFAVDQLAVKIFETRDMLGLQAANEVGNQIKDLLKNQGSANMIFAAAPSQNEFLTALAQQRDIDWGRINAFHMDEYVGLDSDHPEAFGRFLREKIFGQLPFRHVYYLNGNAEAIDTECKRYSDLLANASPDIVCMGIGENTHVAFNDPHVADFNDPLLVKEVNLDVISRQQQVNDGCFERIEDVPVSAITLTVPALLRAKYIYCMVPGTNKADAVYHTLHNEVSEKYPSTSLRVHPHATLYLDKESAGKLTKGITHVQS